MFFSYEHLEFRYDPYPVGLAKPLMDASFYADVVKRFPPVEIMTSHADVGRQGEKYTLSKKLTPRRYAKFVRADPVWREFHRWISSDAFVYELLETLSSHDIDLGFRRMSSTRRSLKRLAGRVARGKVGAELSRLKARFEFSALSANGGHLLPHTDSPGKVATIVVPILHEDDWDPSFGGATDINVPIRDADKYNLVNHKAGFDDMGVAHSYPYAPNQGLVFVKTHNSWHSVRPMTGKEDGSLRRTLTINVEMLG